MIRQTIYISRYGWKVHCYFAVDCYYTEEIMQQLRRLHCPESLLRQAYSNLSSCRLDTGLTYANPNMKEAVMVVALTSSAAEFFNSLSHELNHLQEYICHAESIPLASEAEAYLVGGLARSIYPKVRSLLCDHCRQSKGSYRE